MIIQGKYFKDSNATWLFTEDTMYTIVSSTNWNYVKIGGNLFIGGKLTTELFEELKKKASKYGAFEILTDQEMTYEI